MGRGASEDAEIEPRSPRSLGLGDQEIEQIDRARLRALDAAKAIALSAELPRRKRSWAIAEMNLLLTHLESAVSVGEARLPRGYAQIAERWRGSRVSRAVTAELVARFERDLAVVLSAFEEACDISRIRAHLRGRARERAVADLNVLAAGKTKELERRQASLTSVETEAAGEIHLLAKQGFVGAPTKTRVRVAERTHTLSTDELLALGAAAIHAAAFSAGISVGEATWAAGLIG